MVRFRPSVLMYLLILWLPLISAVGAATFGRFLGSKGVSSLTVTAMLCTWLTALYIFFEIVLCNSEAYLVLWTWVLVDLGLQFDSLSAIMLVIVTTISLLVHAYSTEYLREDPHLPRFMSYLSLFTWFMLVLVTADNMLQLFIGWEGVGLCSYLLINFWFTRLQANKSAMKAMIVNRIGDVGIVLAIVICYAEFKSVKFGVIFNMAENGQVDVICLMLLLGAVGKSAQLGLHSWLPEAMEGPTPVSSLIHAATMVTAGVFLLIRWSPLLELSPLSLSAVTILGASTALFAATTGLVQNDIKKVIAYSTCSQLGYMVFACGISAYSSSIFHLFNHAFFKALLFLSAGSVIHALGDEQDLRKMGAAGKALLPLTYTTILIGSLSLMGFPFLTGFYSKDAIIEMAYASFTVESTFAHWLGCLSALLTAIYSIRLISLAFFKPIQSPGSRITLTLAHDSPPAMAIPLLLLAFASIFIGYIMKDLVMGPASPYLSVGYRLADGPLDSEFIPVYIKWVPVALSILGAIVALGLPPGARSLANAWDNTFVNPVVLKVLDFGYEVTYKILDRGLIEEIGPNGAVKVISHMSKMASNLQSGQIYHYSLTIIIGTLAFLTQM